MVYNMIMGSVEHLPGLEDKLHVTNITVYQRKELLSFSKNNTIYQRYHGQVTFFLNYYLSRKRVFLGP